MTLPEEYRFDVVKARKGLEALAANEPEATIALTLAQLGDDGMEAESEVRLQADAASALLATVGEDQCLQTGNRRIVVLRVMRCEESPPTPQSEEW